MTKKNKEFDELKKEDLQAENEEEVKEEVKDKVTEDNKESKVEETEDCDSKLHKLEEQIFKLKDENNKLSNELDTMKERAVSLAAEYENFRKRTKKEKECIYIDACEDILKEMFPVLDNLERAVSVDGSVEDLKKGIEMTIRQFQSAFKKLGVEEIDANGEFDPNFHQAVMHIQDENLDKNSVAEVFQKGYKKGDKVLRYTMVKVAN